MTTRYSLSLNTGQNGKETLDISPGNFDDLEGTSVNALKMRISFPFSSPGGDNIMRHTETFVRAEDVQTIRDFISGKNGKISLDTGKKDVDTIDLSIDTIVEGEREIPAIRMRIMCPPVHEGQRPFMAITAFNYATADAIVHHLNSWLRYIKHDENPVAETKRVEEPEVKLGLPNPPDTEDTRVARKISTRLLQKNTSEVKGKSKGALKTLLGVVAGIGKG
jgi:hypothetical protein